MITNEEFHRVGHALRAASIKTTALAAPHGPLTKGRTLLEPEASYQTGSFKLHPDGPWCCLAVRDTGEVYGYVTDEPWRRGRIEQVLIMRAEGL